MSRKKNLKQEVYLKGNDESKLVKFNIIRDYPTLLLHSLLTRTPKEEYKMLDGFFGLNLQAFS